MRRRQTTMKPILTTLGIDPFNLHNSVKILCGWVVVFGILSLSFSVHGGGLSFGSHVSKDDVNKAMGDNNKHFVEMTNFIDTYYPTSDGVARGWFSIAELGFAKSFEGMKEADEGFRYKGNEILKNYTYHANRSDIFMAGRAPTTLTNDATPFYAFANSMFKDLASVGGAMAKHPMRDISSFHTCFTLVNAVQDSFFISWVVLFGCGLLAIFNSMIGMRVWGEHNQKRIDTGTITAINILTVSVWGVMMGVWMSGVFTYELCGHMLTGHIQGAMLTMIVLLTVGVIVTCIYISAGYWAAEQPGSGDDTKPLMQGDQRNSDV